MKSIKEFENRITTIIDSVNLSREEKVEAIKEVLIRGVAHQFADDAEKVRDVEGFENVLSWNKDYQQKIEELKQ